MWWKLVDKKRLHIIFTFGLLILIFNSFLDDIGTGSVWWFYPHKIIPTLNILKAPDWALVPCGMMLVFQYSKTWKRFLILNFLLSLLFALIGEPLFISLGLYELVSWNLIYSILHYNIVGFLARWIVLKIHKIST
ncbi:CBO0543 family protein [Neobacillus mesonae]|uniref:CBO0543 family protein n=1 Tax=Neobacillus mesonae TaxID=1193713 RepID=UPI003305A39B